MKTIQVAAAVLRRGDRIFATQRGYGAAKDGWEFPGGKLEPGETPEQALRRELREELELDVQVGDLLTVVEYDYPDFHLSMSCFWAEITGGEPLLKEHEAACWLSLEELDRVAWLSADRIAVRAVKEALSREAYLLAQREIPPGRYRHFKGREYEVLGIARHSETEAPLVVYRPLYGEGGLWVRPAGMWNETVERDGQVFRRFERICEE